MEELSAPMGLIIFVGLVGILSIYLTARRRSKEFHQKKRRFQVLSEHFLEYRDFVSDEADHWPIYARPLMFTELDHKAQIEFAKAQQSLTDAHEIIPVIENSATPETPVQFHLAYLFRLFKNLNSIQISDHYSKYFNDFEERVLALENSIKNIRLGRYRVEDQRRKVRRDIRELNKRIETTNARLRSMDTWNAIDSNSFSWVVNVADNCHLTARAQVTRHPDDEQGYLEHALAAVFVEVGNFALDCADLFVESQQISHRYELDTFSGLFKESIEFLRSIVAMDNDWNGWRKLQRAKSHIDGFPARRQQAATSLRLFKFQQQTLEKLIKLINEVEITREIESVDALEKECTHYWYSYEERKSDWEQALGSPPRFPSTELRHFQTQLLTKVFPPIAADMFIKQSRVNALIRMIGQALEWFNTIKGLIARLEATLRLHKESQRVVNELLSSQGKATVMLEQVRLAIADTSPDISDEGLKIVKEHQSYAERALKVRGANFPELEAEVAGMMMRSGDLIARHNLEVAKLMGEYNALARQIEGAIDEVKNYINHAPYFDPPTVKVLSDAYKDGWVMLQESAKEKYSWLRTMTNQMRTWVQNSGPFIQQTRQIHEAFLVGKRQVEDQFRKTKNEIKLQRTHVERKWGWYRNEALPFIDSAEQALDMEVQEWKRLEERNWAELAIHKGIARCEQLAKFSEEILNVLNQQMAAIKQKQNTLDSKVIDIQNMSFTNRGKLSEEEQQEIRKLMGVARSAQHYDTVEEYLELATALAMKRASRRVRREIQKIIHIHAQQINSEGGPVFLDDVDNRYGGKIRGRRDTFADEDD